MISQRLTFLKNVLVDVKKVPVRYARKVTNPGIQKRAQLFSREIEDIEETDFENYESDFMSVHKSHKQHVQELEATHEQEKYHIVRRKYFKEKYPNFLTWHDKEQMRYLHTTDPREWTVEKLSEGFPALPETIAKIVTSKWTKKNQNKISNHDTSVQENWQLFKKGKMSDLRHDLKIHLKKFTGRALILTPFNPTSTNNKNIVTVRKTPACTEFSDIILEYEKLKNKTKTKDIQEDNIQHGELQNKPNTEITQEESNNFDTSLPVSQVITSGDATLDKYRCKPVTLDSYKARIERKASLGKYVEEDEKIIIDQLNTVSNQDYGIVELKKEELTQIAQDRFSKNNTYSLSQPKTQKNISHLLYPEKISIPSKMRKQGSIYKLNDCYYDVDGQFLYRVPGMVS